MAGDQERCINAGMDDYVSKPIAIGALRNVIGRATNRMLLRLD
jgi:CheY-like chemotaxis protein